MLLKNKTFNNIRGYAFPSKHTKSTLSWDFQTGLLVIYRGCFSEFDKNNFLRAGTIPTYIV